MRVLGIDPGLRVTGYGCLDGLGDRARLVEAGVIRLVGAGKVASERIEDGYEAPSGPAEELARAIAGTRKRKTPSAASVSARLLELERDFCELLERLKPQVVAVEQMFAHAKHPATVIIMAHARGVLLVNIKRAGLRLVELRPNEVKKSMTGHGLAGKEQMQRSIQAHFGLAEPPEPPDVADAMAIALCAARRLQVEMAIRGGG